MISENTDTPNNLKTFRRLSVFFAGLVCLTLFVSCAAPNYELDKSVELPERFSRSGEKKIKQKWWKELEDPTLNKLIGQALDKNFDLKAVWDRLDQARAVARKEGTALWPQLDGSASASRITRDQDSGTLQGKSAEGDSTYSEYSLGLEASYEVDIWGKVRAAADAAQLNAEASASDVQAAALSLTAQVANTWYQLVSQRGQLNLLNQQIETNNRYLDLVELRFGKGEASSTDVLQQRKLVEATRTDRDSAQAELQTLKHQLAVLLGKVPGQTEFPEKAQLPELPSLPETGIPAKLLRERPDVRSAYLRVRSNDRAVAEAIAEKYPRVRISASFQSSAATPSALLEEWLASLAGNIAAPLFDAGRRQAEVDRSRAVVAESLHKYGNTLLTAVREVEDALSNEKQQRQALKGIRQQLRLSKDTMTQLVRRYRNGTIDFLKVLDERRTYQKLQRQYLQARMQLVRDRVDLYRALAGAWDVERSGERKSAPSGPGKS